MAKKYTSSPLPFQGQKRFFVKKFVEALGSCPDDATYVDLFGGSGLLSQVVKQEKPNARVIYNDFDNFSKRLKAIPITNAILHELRPFFDGLPTKTKVPKELKNKALPVIEKYEEQGQFVDYLTFSKIFLFPMKYVFSFEGLEKSTFYNSINKSDYNADGYLQGVEIVNCDYKVLLDEHKNTDNVVFIADPPYLSTDVGYYDTYWGLKDYLEVLNILIETKYFYFTSDKSNLLELLEWLGANTNFKNPLKNANIVRKYNGRNNIKFTDIMINNV